MSRQKKEIREPAVNPKQSDRRIRDFEKQLDILYEAFNKTPVGIAVINKHVFYRSQSAILRPGGL
jgi:hypothetical protein